jgi:hypothetical protein
MIRRLSRAGSWQNRVQGSGSSRGARKKNNEFFTKRSSDAGASAWQWRVRLINSLQSQEII